MKLTNKPFFEPIGLSKSFFVGLVLLLVSALPLFAQDTGFRDFYTKYWDARRHNSEFFSTIGGSPYKTPGFIEGEVYFKGNDTPVKSKLRYNNFFDEIEYPDSTNGFLVLAKKETIDKVVIGDNCYRYTEFENGNKRKSGYFIELVNGEECKLFVKYPIEYVEDKPAQGYQDFVPQHFEVKDEQFYIQIKETPLQRLPTSMKKVGEMLTPVKSTVGDYIKKNKLKAKCDDFVLVAKYCNSKAFDY